MLFLKLAENLHIYPAGTGPLENVRVERRPEYTQQGVGPKYLHKWLKIARAQLKLAA